jgi:Mrp family chromosome partitioning ATPase/predicted Fe-Mo cluster-binding NifX family protein
VAACIALSLARKGLRVGLMDVDLHGPSIPRLLGMNGSIQPAGRAGKAMPINYLPNMQVVSIEALMGEDRDRATIWRGPIKIGVIKQFISDIEWSDLDYLIIDSPPGTGDEPLTIAQVIPDSVAVIVTTPQEIALADVRKSIHFCRQVQLRILGLVENMCGFACPHCGDRIELFKAHGGKQIAEKENLPLLACLPIELEVVRQGDAGAMANLDRLDLPFSREFEKLVEEILERTERKSSTSTGPKEAASGKRLIFAVPVAQGKLSAHFGHCEQFALIGTEDGKIRSTSLHTPPPHEPGVLPRWLHEMGTHIVIAGGMGTRAQQLFEQNGIRVVTGAPQDSPESLVNQYLSGVLITGANICDH